MKGGAIFAYNKLSLSVWFLGIYFITQSKVSVSALSLKRIIGVSYNTALLMKHKIQQVMKERDDSKPLLFCPWDLSKGREGCRTSKMTRSQDDIASAATSSRPGRLMRHIQR
jgi:hypothetical protein